MATSRYCCYLDATERHVRTSGNPCADRFAYYMLWQISWRVNFTSNISSFASLFYNFYIVQFICHILGHQLFNCKAAKVCLISRLQFYHQSSKTWHKNWRVKLWFMSFVSMSRNTYTNIINQVTAVFMRKWYREIRREYNTRCKKSKWKRIKKDRSDLIRLYHVSWLYYIA